MSGAITLRAMKIRGRRQRRASACRSMKVRSTCCCISSRSAELDPHDVTTSQITEQYLGYVEMLGQLNLDIAGEYLVMAATLLLIKSFALLPHPELAPIPKRSRNCSAIWSSGCSNISAIARPRRNSASATILGRDVFVAPGEPCARRPERQPQFTVIALRPDRGDGRGAQAAGGQGAARHPCCATFRSRNASRASWKRSKRASAIEFISLFEDVERPLAGGRDFHRAARTGAASRGARIPGSALRPDFPRARLTEEVGELPHEDCRFLLVSRGATRRIPDPRLELNGRRTTQGNSRKPAFRGR